MSELLKVSQFLPWALVGALVTKVLDWVLGQKQLRATRSSLSILVIEEFVQIREILVRKPEFGGLRHILSIDAMVQRGGFEKLDFVVVTRMVELFRLLEEISHLEQEIGSRQARDQLDSVRIKAVRQIKDEIERQQQEALEKVTAFLPLIWEKEHRFLKRTSRRAVAQRLTAVGLDVHRRH